MLASIDIHAIVDLANRAGQKIMTYYGGDIKPDLKPDNSPVTEADLESNKMIVDFLTEKYPSIPIISEESKIVTFQERKDWERFWLVDPLDGTKEFINQNGEFTVNIGLIDHGVPVIGVIYAPSLNLGYFAKSDEGAWKVHGASKPERIYSNLVGPDVPKTVVESRSHPSKELESFLKTIPVEKRIKIGSSLKFCYLAEGKANLYARLAPTMEWDVAAGDCIFRESAKEGKNKSPLTYNKQNLRNESFTIGL